MAIKISEMTDGSPAVSTDELEINRAGTTFSVNAQSIASLSGNTIYQGDGTLTSSRSVNSGSFNIAFVSSYGSNMTMNNGSMDFTSNGTYSVSSIGNMIFEGANFQISAPLGLSRGTTATSGNTNAIGTTIIGVTDTSSARTITLSTENATSGQIYIIKDESGAAGTNAINVGPMFGSIDGTAFVQISTNYGVLRVYAVNTTTWFTF